MRRTSQAPTYRIKTLNCRCEQLTEQSLVFFIPSYTIQNINSLEHGTELKQCHFRYWIQIMFCVRVTMQLGIERQTAHPIVSIPQVLPAKLQGPKHQILFQMLPLQSREQLFLTENCKTEQFMKKLIGKKMGIEQQWKFLLTKYLSS